MENIETRVAVIGSIVEKRKCRSTKTYLFWQNNQNDGKNTLFCHQNDGKIEK